jgi:hypothetical protein
MHSLAFSPLTPALSPLRGEGEEPKGLAVTNVRFRLGTRSRLIPGEGEEDTEKVLPLRLLKSEGKELPTFLPLPFLKGEGRGEGSLLTAHECECLRIRFYV